MQHETQIAIWVAAFFGFWGIFYYLTKEGSQAAAQTPAEREEMIANWDKPYEPAVQKDITAVCNDDTRSAEVRLSDIVKIAGAEGYRLHSHSAAVVQLVKDKRFSWLIFISWFVFGAVVMTLVNSVVGFLAAPLYLLYFFVSRPEYKTFIMKPQKAAA